MQLTSMERIQDIAQLSGEGDSLGNVQKIKF